VLLTLVVLLGTGVIVANLFGRKLVEYWEQLLSRIPLVRSIYSGVKQIMETVFHSQGQAFRKVLLVEFPRKGMWAIGFQSGVTRGEAQVRTSEEVVNVFIPTTPNPTSGFFVMVPKKDLIELDMSVDEGLKMIISAGVVVPEWTEEQVQAHRRKQLDPLGEEGPP
jgi:uncharacterized membrane protein